jgi:hypothetical protein
MSFPEWVPLPEAARLLSLSERTARRRCETGKLESQRIANPKGGTMWVVSGAAIDAATTPPLPELAATMPPNAATLGRLENDVREMKAFLVGQASSREALQSDIQSAIEKTLAPLIEQNRILQSALDDERAALKAADARAARPKWRRWFGEK